ncbi:hypothetical protein F5883DRAFT_583353 [Diaporthe sp. PMI_573]|nr:hypothetical protein F5883DRAFT_583353 [Diaporthaceae sp. PMI_573]
MKWEDIYNRRFKGPIMPLVRFAGDTQCFDIYPEEDTGCDEYSDEMRARYDMYFKDF